MQVEQGRRVNKTKRSTALRLVIAAVAASSFFG
jgi:hypothetical protein